MKLLLDTHIWTWMADNPRRLGRKTSAALVDLANELWLSPVSVAEFLTLCRKGRYPGASDPQAWLHRALTTWQLRDAVVTREIALETGLFSMPHKDPADRWLVATARVMGVKLVTADRLIIASGAVDVIPND